MRGLGSQFAVGNLRFLNHDEGSKLASVRLSKLQYPIWACAILFERIDNFRPSHLYPE